jgi:3-phenylpropionate/cinnamic acid dioxygenase small subunit
MADDATLLRRLAASDEIRQLLHRCSELVDAGDFAGVAALFAHATLTAAGTDVRVSGAADIEAVQREAFRDYDGALRTKHLVMNTIVELAQDGATATARSCFVVLQAVPDEFPLAPIMAGRYHDSFERADDGWRFTARHTLPDLLGDVSHHLRIHVEG